MNNNNNKPNYAAAWGNATVLASVATLTDLYANIHNMENLKITATFICAMSAAYCGYQTYKALKKQKDSENQR